jgi:RNA polymerase sigma-70 factor (ECF subfamily)
MGRSEPLAESPAELAERIRSGTDRDAEARLVERYARGVRLVLDRHTRTAAEAEDLFQETFHLAVAKLRADDLRDPSKLPAFLASLARNLATEHYRKTARRRTEADSEAAEAAVTFAGSPLGELLRGEEAALVRRTLEDLATERDREILFRFYIAEEDREVIAAEHGLTGAQLNRLLYRARQRYKALYLERLVTHGHVTAVAGAFLGGLVATLAVARVMASWKC